MLSFRACNFNLLTKKNKLMISATPDCTYFFRVPADKPGEEGDPTILEQEAEDPSPEEEEYILCRQCHQAITQPAERIAMQGSHRHTFANPHGMVFDIACFRSVASCGYAGPPSNEFTWFKGFSWRIAVCGMCLTHLGWLFTSGSGSSFHGLIRNRIKENS